MAEPKGGLLCVSLIPDGPINRDELIAEAHDQLCEQLDDAGLRLAGPSTWRLFDAADVPGWEWWAGQLLIATAPSETVGGTRGR